MRGGGVQAQAPGPGQQGPECIGHDQRLRLVLSGRGAGRPKGGGHWGGTAWAGGCMPINNRQHHIGCQHRRVLRGRNLQKGGQPAVAGCMRARPAAPAPSPLPRTPPPPPTQPHLQHAEPLLRPPQRPAAGRHSSSSTWRARAHGAYAGRRGCGQHLPASCLRFQLPAASSSHGTSSPPPRRASRPAPQSPAQPPAPTPRPPQRPPGGGHSRQPPLPALPNAHAEGGRERPLAGNKLQTPHSAQSAAAAPADIIASGRGKFRGKFTHRTS